LLEQNECKVFFTKRRADKGESVPDLPEEFEEKDSKKPVIGDHKTRASLGGIEGLIMKMQMDFKNEVVTFEEK
jgi:hypothetical protein